VQNRRTCLPCLKRGILWRMRNTLLPILLAAACAATATSASAAPYDNVFFVKKGATSAQLFTDRSACADVAKGVQIGRDEAYSDPDYGVLSAMGTAIDSDSMHRASARRSSARRLRNAWRSVAGSSRTRSVMTPSPSARPAARTPLPWTPG
jgi:hypothetical protein